MIGSFLAAALAIVGGTVHRGDGPPLENATVVIDGQRIVAVGVGAPVPAGATIIDAKGKVVTPGLIDAWTSLGLVEIEAIEETHDDVPGSKDGVAAANRAADGYNPDSAVLPVQRVHGVTTALTAPEGPFVAGQAAVFDLDGDALVSASVGLVVDLGGGTVGAAFGTKLARLRELLADARDYAKNRKAYEKNAFRRVSASRLDLEALQPVLDGELPLLAKVHKRTDILAVLRLADAERVKLIVVGGGEAWLCADELARAKVPVIIDPVANAPDDFDRLRQRGDAAARLEKAGVQVILSTFSTHNVRKLRQWAGNAVREGMSAEGALAAITSTPAAAFGLKDHGLLQPGRVGNVVVWSGDPFEPLTRAEAVVVRGRVVPFDNRQRALLERYRKLPTR